MIFSANEILRAFHQISENVVGVWFLVGGFAFRSFTWLTQFHENGSRETRSGRYINTVVKADHICQEPIEDRISVLVFRCFKSCGAQ
jgi:hypothetical protein